VVKVQEPGRQCSGSLLAIDQPPGIGDIRSIDVSSTELDPLGLRFSLPEQQRTDRISSPKAVEEFEDLLVLPS